MLLISLPVSVVFHIYAVLPFKDGPQGSYMHDNDWDWKFISVTM